MYTANNKEELKEYLLKASDDLQKEQIQANTAGMPFIAIPIPDDVVAAGKKFSAGSIFIAYADGSMSVEPHNGLQPYTKTEFSNKQEVIGPPSKNIVKLTTVGTVEDAIYKNMLMKTQHAKALLQGADGTMVCKYTIPKNSQHVATDAMVATTTCERIMGAHNLKAAKEPVEQQYSLQASRYIAGDKYKKEQSTLLDHVILSAAVCDGLLKRFHNASIDEQKEIMEQVRQEKSILDKAIEAVQKSQDIVVYDNAIVQELKKQIEKEIKQKEIEHAIRKTTPPEKQQEKKAEKPRENPYVQYLYGMLCMSCNLHKEEAMHIASQLSDVEVSSYGKKTMNTTFLNNEKANSSPDISDLRDGSHEVDISGQPVNGGSITGQAQSIAEMVESAKKAFYVATGINAPEIEALNPAQKDTTLSYMDQVNRDIEEAYKDEEDPYEERKLPGV